MYRRMQWAGVVFDQGDCVARGLCYQGCVCVIKGCDQVGACDSGCDQEGVC